MGLVIYLATSKLWQYSSWRRKTGIQHALRLFMFICAGLGSSTLYWGLLNGPIIIKRLGLNIAPRSQQALEFSVPYSFFHWGISARATYTLASLIMAYHFHVRKNKGLSLSGIIAAITGVRPQGPWGKTGRFDVPDRHCRRTDHFPLLLPQQPLPVGFPR
ncbi:BCCT family transporter [Escherichia coli]